MLGGGRGLTNLVNHVVVGRGGELRHDRLQIGAAEGTLIGQTRYDISADARLTQSLATLGGALVRNEIHAVMQGAGHRGHAERPVLRARASARRQPHPGRPRGARQHRATSSTKASSTVSRRAVFAGKIVVRRDAQKTNAYQSNNNLLLSPDAEIDTKPELEIFADDVKCSHGATAGELDERELFYLRSRGLDLATARSVLTFAFAGEVLERFGNPAIARQARAGLLSRLPGGAALGELA